MKLAAMSRGSCPTLAVRSAARRPWHRRHIVDHVGERRTGAAVDAGVMHLGIEPDLVVLHAFEDIELPQRTGAVEKLGMHPADDALQRRPVVRRREAAAEDVAVDVELVVLDPARVIDVQRRLFQPRLQDRRNVQPRTDHRLEVLEEIALVILGQAEDRHASDMHRHFRRFQIQKRRVHRRQFLGVTHGFLPSSSRRDHAAPCWRFWRSDDPGFRTLGQDCAFSEGAYAMANGPDRSNWLNSPSVWARRSAIAHKAAELTPSPIWLAR